jgi:O-methyltransferase
MIKLFNKFLKLIGLKLIRPSEVVVPTDADEKFKNTFYTAKPYTMTSLDRMYAAYNAMEYVENNKVEGAVVECGVWRGGSAMVMAMKLVEMGSNSREFYLYDTYEGMTEPTDKDVDFSGKISKVQWVKSQKNGVNEWCLASVEEVKHNMEKTKYPIEKFHFVKGKVEETIPAIMPERISILRLDTDWYESTKHEMEHLFPKLSVHGVLIIDDYGHWKGSRLAIDEYFTQHNIYPLLNRIDYSGRLYIKL